jgi:DNA segregation ATPase FtsK/SpoIIIE, S-DNA-T family
MALWPPYGQTAPRAADDDGEPPNLPAVPEAEVLDGEIIDDAPAPQAPAAPSPVQLVVHVVKVVMQHEHTKTVGRHLGYIPAGLVVVAKRLRDSRTTSPYQRYMRAAEATGNHEAALDWEERRAEFMRDRHRRRMDYLNYPVQVLLVLPKVLGSILLALVTLGILLAIATGHIAEFSAPVLVVAHVVLVIGVVISVAWTAVLLTGVALGLAALWQIGRTAGGATWTLAKKQDGEDGGIIITADTIVLALRNLDKIPALKKAFKDAWMPSFHTVPIRDGRGYFAVFGVPLGVTAEMIADQRPVFARNVHRAEVEVWPSNAEKAGVGPPGSVAVWIADSGVISKAAPEYPLMHEGTTDVFQGVPSGVVARGDGILVPIVGNNGVAGGMQGQGKSNACRVLMLGGALDPLAELDAFVFANNGDFDAFAPRLRYYRKGVEDDVILAALGRLHELYSEVGRREGRLAELGAKKLSRGIAEAHPDLRPVLSLYSECHELFGHPEYGEEAAEIATKTIKRARKTGIFLLFDTQSSRKEAIPPKLVELVSVNICFYCKTWRSNDGFLGDGSFAAGIRATELRPGRDRGTSIITGVSDSQFELLRWYFIEVDDDTGYDAAAEVIARSMANLAPGTRASGSVPGVEEERRDLLDDLAAVLGDEDEPVRIADLPALLRALAPSWGPYRALTGIQLREQLTGAGVRTTNPGNVPRLDPADLYRVLTGARELGRAEHPGTRSRGLLTGGPNQPHTAN